MARCEMCGNEYDKSFQVVMAGETHTFDCFECAIAMMAPECAHCGCKVIGHGIETEDAYFCCAHCARQSGITGAHDRTSERSDLAMPVA